MTLDEAIKHCTDMAIEALEQEPILDKIRAEIIKLQTYKMFEGEDTVYVERDDVLEVLKQYIDLTDIIKTPKQPDIPKQPAFVPTVGQI